jgi:hypothetical protein
MPGKLVTFLKRTVPLAFPEELSVDGKELNNPEHGASTEKSKDRI